MAEGGTFGSASELLVRKIVQARKERGLSLEEVGEITRIKRNHLENIESGNLGFLPAVYVYAFLKECALALEVADEELLENCREELGIPSDAKIQQEAAMATSGHQESRGNRMAELFDAFTARGGTLQPALIVGGGAVLLAALLAVVFFLFTARPAEESGDPHSGGASDHAAVAEPQDSLAEAATAPDTLEEQPSDPEASLAVKQEEWAADISFLPESSSSPYGKVLVVRIVEDLTWVKVIADDGDREYPGGQFKAGEVHRYEAKKKFWVNIGRPPFVELYVNGEKVPPMRKRTVVLGDE